MTFQKVTNFIARGPLFSVTEKYLLTAEYLLMAYGFQMLFFIQLRDSLIQEIRFCAQAIATMTMKQNVSAYFRKDVVLQIMAIV